MSVGGNVCVPVWKDLGAHVELHEFPHGDEIRRKKKRALEGGKTKNNAQIKKTKVQAPRAPRSIYILLFVYISQTVSPEGGSQT